MAQLVASVSAVELGGVAEVVGLNLARGKIFTISLHIYIYIYIYALFTEEPKPFAIHVY